MKFEFQTFAYKELELRSQLVEEELVGSVPQKFATSKFTYRFE